MSKLFLFFRLNPNLVVRLKHGIQQGNFTHRRALILSASNSANLSHKPKSSVNNTITVNEEFKDSDDGGGDGKQNYPKYALLSRSTILATVIGSIFAFVSLKKKFFQPVLCSGNGSTGTLKTERGETCDQGQENKEPNGKSRTSENDHISFRSADGTNKSVPSWLAEQMKTTTAYHEAGHVVCAWFFPHVKEVCEVSIVPEGRRGGYTKFQKDDKVSTEEELFDQLCVDLAGMAAEELFLGGVTPLSNSDDMAHAMHLAAIAFSRLYVQLGLASQNYDDEQRKHVEKTLELTLICKAYARTLEFLREHQEDVRKIACHLLERQTLSTAEMTEILGKRPTPWKSRFF